MPTEPSTAPSPPSDNEIIERVLGGELAQFEHLMRRHNARVYRAARAILRDDSEAEDVMQDTFVRAYEHLRQFEQRARFSTWLTRIAVHEALARVRKAKRFAPLDAHAEESPMPSVPGPEQQASAGELRSLLDAAVTRLPDDFRAVFVLRDVEGMTGAETADCLGIPEETVKTRLHRARARLQQTLLATIEPELHNVYSFHLSRCDRVVDAVLRRISARQ